ncbi:hypothetical protein BDI4_590008 [Burkholderia diffusa]|nr:hypothetical protein BDI4_590008 [Burkholderia diffusa]
MPDCALTIPRRIVLSVTPGSAAIPAPWPLSAVQHTIIASTCLPQGRASARSTFEYQVPEQIGVTDTLSSMLNPCPASRYSDLLVHPAAYHTAAVVRVN